MQKAISLGYQNRVRLTGGVLEGSPGVLTGRIREDGQREVLLDSGLIEWACYESRKMYCISMVCCAAELAVQRWSKILWSSQPLSPGAAAMAFAQGQAPLPDYWTQVTETILRYASVEKGLGVGSVVLMEDGKWSARYNREFTESCDSLEAAICSVELWATNHHKEFITTGWATGPDGERIRLGHAPGVTTDPPAS